MTKSAAVFLFLLVSGCASMDLDQAAGVNADSPETRISSTYPCNKPLDESGACEERFLMLLPIDAGPVFVLSGSPGNNLTVSLVFESQSDATSVRNLASRIRVGQEPRFIGARVLCTAVGRWISRPEEDPGFAVTSIGCEPSFG